MRLTLPRVSPFQVVLLIFVSGKIVITGAKASSPSSIQTCPPPPPPSLSLMAFAPNVLWLFRRPFQTRADIYKAFKDMYPALTEFRKTDR